MDRPAQMVEVADRLRRRFGPVDHGDPEPPLDLLVRTILSQNTSDRNRDRAYDELRCRFPTWEDVLAAPARGRRGDPGRWPPSPAGEAPPRRPRPAPQRAGALTLDFLAQLPDEEAAQWLLSLPGVGKKTAYVVLLFGFGRPFFPVDTHIARVTTRLGLTDTTGDPHDALAPLVPPGKERELHLHLIRLGREVCRPRQPRCPACPLLDVCPYGQKETR